MSQRCKDIHSIPFKKYAEDFNPIDSKMESVVVPRDESSRKMIEALQYTGVGNIRKLQPYVCSLYQRELDDLIRQHVVADFGTGIYCLTNEDYYDEKMGVLFEAKDYIID